MTLIDCLKFLFKEDDNNPLSPEEMRVYMTLLKEWNRLGRPEWFEYSLIPKLLPKLLPNVLPKMVVTRTRDKLQKRGLIQYVSGNGRVKNPCYKICFVTKDVTKLDTQNDTKPKEKVSPTPPLKEIYSELREKERISKDIPKKEYDLSFCLPTFVPIMEEWLSFKKEKGQTYKPIGLKVCYKNLIKISNSDPDTARLIVEKSIANNWSGLFELKNYAGQIQNSNHSSCCSKQEANDYALQQFLDYRRSREEGMVTEMGKPF